MGRDRWFPTFTQVYKTYPSILNIHKKNKNPILDSAWKEFY